MASDLRQTGISVVGDVPWGTHLCLFYESSQDLVDTLVPYFKAGLEGNEFCLCVVAEHVSEQDVTRTLGQAVSDFARYLANQAIEIVRPESLYLTGGVFDVDKTRRYWRERLEYALAAGFSGMRVNGDEAWLEREYWADFSEYERALGVAIRGSRMLALCAYPLEKSRPGQLLDVAQAHEYVVAKRGRDWELLETAALKQTKQELKALSGELERRVAQRTIQLQETNEQLRTEITQRKRIEEALIEEQARYRSLFEISHDLIQFLDADGNILDINPRAAQITGYTQDELRGMNVPRDLVVPADRAALRETIKRVCGGQVQQYEVRWKAKDGRIVYFEGVSVPRVSADGKFLSTFCSLRNITVRKHGEQALQAASEELKALSRRLVEIQEAERRQLARELHDRAGQNLTALGINLDIVTARLAGKGDDEVTRRLEDSIALVEATADEIVNVLSELRPPMLDDLGLLPALEWYAREFSTRTGVDVSVVGEDQMRRAPPQAEIALFRIMQEALNNVAKHARARHVDIELTSNGEWELTVSDDGVGLDPHPQPETRSSNRFGMMTMRERALAVGGRFEILPRPGGGTSVVVRVPSI